jgi:hypothetical protein
MKEAIIIALIIFVIVNTKLVFQPKYDHYVVGSRIPSISLIFSSDGLKSIWIGDDLYTIATEEELDNI